MPTKRKASETEAVTTTSTTAKATVAKRAKKAVSSTAAMPSAHTSQQKAEIAQFQSITNASSSVAAKFLKQHGWNGQVAVNSFFNNGSNTAANPTRKTLDKLFDSYRTDPRNSPNDLNIDGISRLLTDLQVSLEDIAALIFFEAVSSPQLGAITREGFVDAFADTTADSVPKIRNHILARRAEIPRDKALFKRVYNHTFSLLLEERKKAIELDQAEGFWRVLFSSDGFQWRGASGTPWLDWWMEFLNAKWGKAINKDLWRQTLTFAQETVRDEKLGFWNQESSWPSVIDEFVEWVKTEKRPGGGDDMDVE